MSEKIKCEVCGEEVHAIQLHLAQKHPEMTLEQYQAKFPSAPLLSAAAIAKIEQRNKELAATAKPASKPFHEVFGFDASVRQAMSSRGSPIPITVLGRGQYAEMIPDVDDGYILTPDETKEALLAFELNVPLYVWGLHGTGKTELIEQICARTNRPLLRVQHTASTEESSIVGNLQARGGSTFFEYGALPLAMINGWTYLADEYDFALPNVIATYQAVLEGKPLIIKEAEADKRVVKPHPNFRFVATGNTNGSGDETGLYQGTMIQNAASYDRFQVVLEKRYPEAPLESALLSTRCKIDVKHADKFVDFANRIRGEFRSGGMSSTVSPRVLIAAIRVGERLASWTRGLELAYINKLSRVDQEKARNLAQRVFG